MVVPIGRAHSSRLLHDARWSLCAQGLAIAFSFAHTLEDWYVGLFGTDRANLSPLAGALLALHALIYAAWAIALATQRDRAWMAVVFVFTFGWAFLVSGVSIAFCLPPCAALAPYGDIAHLGNLVFGGWASVQAWRQLRMGDTHLGRGPATLAILLLVATNLLASTLAAEFIASQR